MFMRAPRLKCGPGSNSFRNEFDGLALREIFHLGKESMIGKPRQLCEQVIRVHA